MQPVRAVEKYPKVQHQVEEPEGFTLGDLRRLTANLPDSHKVVLWHGAGKLNVSLVEAFSFDDTLSLVGSK